MRIAKVTIQGYAGYIFLVKSLLYNYYCASSGIIEAIRDDFRKPHIGIGADGLRFHQHSIVGVVYDEPIAAFPYTDTANGSGQLPAGLIIGEFNLGELFVGYLESIAPKSLISIIHDHVAATHIVAFGKMRGITGANVPIGWMVLRSPFPS